MEVMEFRIPAYYIMKQTLNFDPLVHFTCTIISPVRL